MTVPPTVLTPPVPPARPRRRLRLWLAMGAGLMALLCLGGVGVFVSLYDGATKIKRTAPDAVVDNYLGAYLVNRNDQDAALYTCKSGADLTAFAELRRSLTERERQFGTTVTVTWEALTVSETAKDQRSVAADLTIVGSSKGQQVSSHTESWTFRVVDQDGWRVCGANKVG